MYVSKEIYTNLCNWEGITEEQVSTCKGVIKNLFTDVTINLKFNEFFMTTRAIEDSIWINENTSLKDYNGESVYEIVGCRIIISSDKKCHYPCYELYINKTFELVHINLQEEKIIQQDSIKQEDNGKQTPIKLNDTYVIEYSEISTMSDNDEYITVNKEYVLINNKTNDKKYMKFIYDNLSDKHFFSGAYKEKDKHIEYVGIRKEYFYKGTFYLMEFKENMVEFVYGYPDYGITYVKCSLDLLSGIVLCHEDMNYDYPEPIGAKCVDGKKFYIFLLTDCPKTTTLYNCNKHVDIPLTIDGIYSNSKYDKWCKIFEIK